MLATLALPCATRAQQQLDPPKGPPDSNALLPGPIRPLSVPADFQVTPFGYYHPSCIKRLAEGESVVADGKVIRHIDGTEDTIPACEFPHFNSH